MANWRYTNIQHPARIALGLTVVEYCVLDIVYQSQTHPSHTKNGWSDAGCHTIGRFLGLSSGTVKGIFDRLEKFGFMEKGVGALKRTTSDFHDVAYIQNVEEIGGVQKLNVQKLNDKRSKAERSSVHMLNGKRSKAEHISKLKEVESNSKEKVVESYSTVLLDEVDETSVEIHHVPEWFDESLFSKKEMLEPNFWKELEEADKKPYVNLADISKAEQKKPKEKSSAKKEKVTSAEDMDLVHQVVTYLNEKTEQAFQPGGEKTKSLILARHHADKWTLEDFKLVIDHKTSEWFHKDNMRHCLRPSTLFSAGHAEEYLQGAKLWKKKPVATSPGVVPLFRQENFVNSDRSKFKF